MTKLFIIGNGFDIQHNVHFINKSGEVITSSLDDFSKIVKEKNKEIYGIINKGLLDCGYKSWNNLENIDFMTLLRTQEQQEKFHSYIKEWVQNLNNKINEKNFLTDNKKVREFIRLKEEIFDDETYFVNFNYTDTLEKLYNIDKYKICHVHGDSTYPVIAYNPKFSSKRHTGINTKKNFIKPADGLRVGLSLWLKENIKSDDIVTLYVYGFNFNGNDAKYLCTILKHLKVNEIRVSDHQAEDVKEKEKDHLFKNITEIVDNYYKLRGLNMTDFVVDFEGNSLF